VANTLRLTNLPEHTRGLLASGQISAGHARALLAVSNPDPLADRIVADGLTVRDIERFGENSGKTARPRKGAAPVDADTRALEDKLGLALGTKVTIRHGGESGEIRLAFRNLDQLDDFCRRLCQPPTR
jgi:ParB family chromosome partitioning protein